MDKNEDNIREIALKWWALQDNQYISKLKIKH